MARYRKIEVSMYSDQKFMALSKPQPNAQSLWIYLLTGPHTTSIPGLSMIGEAALAEMLGWSMEAFREAFREVSAKGIAKADWKAKVLWIPHAVRHNAPQSPNVIKGWAKAWPEIPECALKVVAFNELKAFIEGLPKGFREVFHKAFAKAWRDQEQEQEQEQEHTPKAPVGGESEGAERSPAPQPIAPVGFVRFWSVWPPHFRKKARTKCLAHWLRHKLEEKANKIVSAVKRAKESPSWTKQDGQYVPGPLKWLSDESWEAAPEPDKPDNSGAPGFVPRYPTEAELDDILGPVMVVAVDPAAYVDLDGKVKNPRGV